MSISFSTKISGAPDVMFRAVGDECVLLNLKSESLLGTRPDGHAHVGTADSSASEYRARSTHCLPNTTPSQINSAKTCWNS